MLIHGMKFYKCTLGKVSHCDIDKHVCAGHDSKGYLTECEIVLRADILFEHVLTGCTGFYLMRIL